MRPRRPRLKKPARAGDLVEAMLQGLGIDEQLSQYKALIIWDEVVGPQISAHTKPTRIRDGVLEVNVDQPAWMQQLQLMKPKILARLNKELGKINLRDIYLKRGKITIRGKSSTQPPPAWRMVNLNEHEKQQIDLIMNAADDDLRAEIGSLLTKQMRLNKARGINNR